VNDHRNLGVRDDSDLEDVSRPVGADEHEESVVEILDADRMIEGMEDVVVVDAMLPSAFGDDWLIGHLYKIACRIDLYKLPWLGRRLNIPLVRPGSPAL
jgi:hypothetical protein